MFDNLHFTFYRVVFVAKEPIHVPEYKGSMIRGAMGHALKKVSCALKRFTCLECPIREKCAYSVCFETPIPQNSEIMKKYPKAPHPFILEPPLDTKEVYEPGEKFICHLTLVGKAQEYLTHFVCALILLAEDGLGKGRGKSKLLSVEYLSGNGKWEMIYDGENDEFFGDPYIFTKENIIHRQRQLASQRQTTIHYLTPTRIVRNGNLHDTGELTFLMPALLRRLTLLQYFFCGGLLEKGVAHIIEQAKDLIPIQKQFKWQDWIRFSSRQERKILMGGFVGSVTYDSIPKDIIEVLCWGEWLHIGKGTVFGLGKYELINDQLI